MTPLCITTHAPIGFVAGAPVHLDALLMSVVARRTLPPHRTPHAAVELESLDIPIARSDCGRYYLASALVREPAEHEVMHVTRRHPVYVALRFGTGNGTIDEGAGRHKAYRFPVERHHARGGLLTWYCIGEREPILDLLSEVTHIGRKRHRGEGMLTLRGERWTVEECATWPGFPVLGPAGEALRNLPLDTPGLASFRHAEAPLEPPYWLPSHELVAVPVRR